MKAIRVLEKAGIAFTVLADEPASGAQLEYLISAADETRQQMTACAEILNEYKTVVAFDPQDAKVFKREYKEWSVELTGDVKTFTAFVAGLLDTGALSAKNTEKRVVFQDPFQLARDLEETEPARKTVNAYAVCDEMLCHGKDTMWAGNILMAQWMPEVMLQVSADRINNAKGVCADTIITASVSEYAALKSVAQTEVKILSLEELILGE